MANLSIFQGKSAERLTSEAGHFRHVTSISESASEPIVGAGGGLLYGAGRSGFDAAHSMGLAPYAGGLGMGGPLIDYSHPTIQKQSYETTGSGMLHMQPIALTLHLTNTLDGWVIAENTTRHQTTWASRPQAAGNSPDYLEVAPRPGVPLVSS